MPTYPTDINYKVLNFPGAQGISVTSTTQNHPLGTIVRAFDAGAGARGEGEFVYAKGVANTAAGDVVVYDSKGASTTRVQDDTGFGNAGVAMSANVASQYGWYCIGGVVPVNSATVAAGAPAYMTSTAGQIDDAVVAGDMIVGMTTQHADANGFAECVLTRPFISQSLG